MQAIIYIDSHGTPRGPGRIERVRRAATELLTELEREEPELLAKLRQRTPHHEDDYRLDLEHMQP